MINQVLATDQLDATMESTVDQISNSKCVGTDYANLPVQLQEQKQLLSDYSIPAGLISLPPMKVKIFKHMNNCLFKL